MSRKTYYSFIFHKSESIAQLSDDHPLIVPLL